MCIGYLLKGYTHMSSFSNGFWTGTAMGFTSGMFGALTGSSYMGMGLGGYGLGSDFYNNFNISTALSESDGAFTNEMMRYNLENQFTMNGFDGTGLGGFGGFGGLLC